MPAVTDGALPVSNAQKGMSCKLAFVPLLSLMLLIGCSQSDKETAGERAAQAREKARRAAERLNRDAKKFGKEVKQDARELNDKLGGALNNSVPASSGASQAESKATRGMHDVHVEAGKAGAKLNQAALIAKVKAKLANDAGLATVSSIDVDASGQVVTLRGTVDSVQQKEQAEQAARQVSGVSRVVDDLRVRQ
jgi:osmotically-inducible protein OsmY